MQKVYTKNYIKIYLWRTLSIISGFLSLLVVVPKLSNSPELYGIYASCISFALYLTYADIGFLSAGQKYAAEAYAQGDMKKELNILGFTGAILLIMIVPFSLSMIYLSYNPEFIIKNLSLAGQKIASQLFLILAVLLPIQIFFQRLVQSILIIRIRDYIGLRIDTFFNLLKISSVFYFFSENNYQIVEFYSFSLLLTILSTLIILVIIKRKEKYNFRLLLKSIRLRENEYSLINKLAYSSLALTIGWIIYYELDLIIIGKILGPKEVATYAIAFTFLNFLRTLWNTVFSPFSQRFNHYVGLKSDIDLKKLTDTIIDYTMPLCVIVTLVLILASEKLIFYWVGGLYSESIIILQILVLGTVFGFITKPASYLFTAKTLYKYIYLSAIICPLIFISCAILSISNYGLVGIAMSKFLAMSGGFIISIFGISKITTPMKFFRKWSIQLLTICLIINYTFSLFLKTTFVDNSKSTMNLVFLLLTMLFTILISYILVLLSKKQQRKDLKIILNSIRNIKF
tara:strand:- start:237 stop:1778 length:1542 start_codon:yes stop_codon:yes gene_type:complete